MSNELKIGDKVKITADNRIGTVVDTTMLKDLFGVTVLVYCNFTKSMQPEWHTISELTFSDGKETTLLEDLEEIIAKGKF